MLRRGTDILRRLCFINTETLALVLVFTHIIYISLYHMTTPKMQCWQLIVDCLHIENSGLGTKMRRPFCRHCS